jgi:hypothetical protein
MIIKEGEEAQDQAREWGMTLRLHRVTKTIMGESAPCRWIYGRNGRGRCVECWVWDNSGLKKDLEEETLDQD